LLIKYIASAEDHYSKIQSGLHIYSHGIIIFQSLQSILEKPSEKLHFEYTIFILVLRHASFNLLPEIYGK